MSIKVENLSFVYGEKTPFEKKALDDISFEINQGEFVGIIGATGSGKSTLIQHLNGLIKLKSGKITVLDIDLTSKKPNLKLLRSGIGMLFQYPEYQLFADTVLDDVMFGPINFGFSKPDARQAAEQAIRLVGLDFETVKDKSPIELSGGQKRRAAIAGVLSYRPKILILDEPTAGLDPVGKREMLQLICSLREAQAVETAIMVSHNMDEIAEFTDRVIVLNESRLMCDTSPDDFFYNKTPQSASLDMPHVVKIVKLLEERGLSLPHDITNAEQLTNALKVCLKGIGGGHA